MDIYLRVDINIVAIVMLLLVHFLAFKRLDKQDSLNRLFFGISQVLIHLLLLETATCIINRRPELWLIPVSSLLHILLFSIAPISTYCWYFLIRKIIFPLENKLRKRHILMAIPVFANVVLTVLSPVFHYVFYIDSENVYRRGSFYVLSAFITYSYVVYGMITILRYRKKLPKRDSTLLLLFIGFPVIGGMIQTLFYGPLLIWSCSAFSLVIAYNYLQQRMVRLDELTGAWDRNSFHNYISQRLTQGNYGFAGIYLDIDKLKEINDSFGHNEGDYVIKMTIMIIRNELESNDIIVRMGGDEFLILLDCNSEEKLNRTVERIKMALYQYNKTSLKNYRLECSIGADLFNAEYKSIEQFIDHIDNLMYRNRQEKREMAWLDGDKFKN